MMVTSRQNDRDLDVLRKYLLGQLDTQARDQVETRLYPADDPPSPEDELFAELLQVAEDDIIDDYQFGNVAYEDHNAMALRFSWTTIRRDKLQLATRLTGLAEASDRSTATAVSSDVTPDADTAGENGSPGRERWRLADLLPAFGGVQAAAWTIPVWAPAAAALLMVLSIAIAFQAGQGFGSGSSVTLLSLEGTERDGGGAGTPTIEPDGELVRLQLDIGVALDEHESYYAELYRLVGTDYQMIRTYGLLRAGDYEGTTAVSLSLPTELVAAGSYYAALYGVTADAERTFIARFDFTIEH